MKTDELISLLAADTAAVPGGGAARQIAVAMALALPLAALTMLVTMGARPDLDQAVRMPMFWVKVVFPAAVACAGFATVARLARPGVSARAGRWATLLPVLLVWLLAGVVYAGAAPAERGALVWGQSWKTCAASVVLVSVPFLVAAFLALRRLAPTKLAQAGAFAGVLAGAAGAAVYAFHCPETALPFIAIWYVAGIAAAAGIGAALGPRLLKW